MKEINQFIVETVMNALIHTNKKTTTLKVKENLLALGYNATLENVYPELKEVLLKSECLSTYEVTYKNDITDKNDPIEISFNANSSIMNDFGFAKEYSLNVLVSKNIY